MDKKLKQIITQVLNKHAQCAYSHNPALRKWIGNTSVIGVVKEIELRYQKALPLKRQGGING